MHGCVSLGDAADPGEVEAHGGCTVGRGGVGENN